MISVRAAEFNTRSGLPTRADRYFAVARGEARSRRDTGRPSGTVQLRSPSCFSSWGTPDRSDAARCISSMSAWRRQLSNAFAPRCYEPAFWQRDARSGSATGSASPCRLSAFQFPDAKCIRVASGKSGRGELSMKV